MPEMRAKVICPCCLGDLMYAWEHPVVRGVAGPGDFFCSGCSWLFVAEMLDGVEPMAQDGLWRCPSHGHYLGAADIRRLLVNTVQVLRLRVAQSDAPAGLATVGIGREERLRHMDRLIAYMSALPDSDPRLVKLAEMAPTPELIMDLIPDEGPVVFVTVGDRPDYGVFLDGLVRASYEG
jgi:hypothetical protein